MNWISDSTLAHLREVADAPDFSGTRYTVVREVGRGGMGVIYEAQDGELQRVVALKVLANEIAGSEAAARMRREAQTIARLEHPGIVPVHDVGQLADGRVFYAMKLVRGETLSKAAALLPHSERMRVFLRLCEAVAFVHAHGVMHGDLKPENVMIGAFGEVLVMDWGVARSIDEDLGGVIAGTKGFMAPEQERGEKVDARSDVYALGRILQTLAEGERIPRRLASMIRKATNADRQARYRDAAELRDDVSRFLDGEPVSAHHESLFEKAGRWIQRNQALVTIVLAYLVMRVIVFLLVRR